MRLANPSTNPFTPDFGQTPPLLVGRDALLDELGSSLATGPRSPGFTTLLIGPRGSGKTAVLNEAVESTRVEGWIVISVDAGTAGIHERIRQVLNWIEAPESTGLSPAGRRELVGVGFYGVTAQWAPTAAVPQLDNRHRLALLARQAEEHDTKVLLCVDEIHAGDRQEMRRLGDDIQHLSKRESLPLAFLGAGLGDIRYGLLSDKKMTFFQRCHRKEVGMISPALAIRGIRDTINDNGGSITTEALNPVGELGYITPYHMQVIGYNVWDISGSPDNPVTEPEVRQSVKLSEPEMMDKLYEPAWYDMPLVARRLLAALLYSDGRGTPAELIQQSGLSRHEYTQARRILDYGGYISKDHRSRVVATGLLPAPAANLLIEDDANIQPANNASGHGTSEPAVERAQSPRCDKPMKRVDGHCILPHDHAGRCRAK